MKILYIPDHNFNLTRLRQRVGEFTLYNGCWPELIIMELKGIEHYQSLLFDPSDKDKLTFNGIKIEENKR